MAPISAVVVILFDLWTFLRHGGDSTVSWRFCLWGMAHPEVVFFLAVLGGHLLLPRCLAPGQDAHETVTRTQGIVGAVLGVLALASLVYRSWNETLSPVVSRRRIALLFVLMVVGIGVGWYYVPQLVTCS